VGDVELDMVVDAVLSEVWDADTIIIENCPTLPALLESPLYVATMIESVAKYPWTVIEHVAYVDLVTAREHDVELEDRPSNPGRTQGGG